MSDLIDRQAAIDVLEERLKANGYSNVALVSELNRSIGYLRRLPAVQRCADCENLSKTQLLIPQPEPRWIPCERELPAVGRSVLISVGGIYTAEGCLRDDGDWAQFRWDAIQRKDMVGAWMPLPEPYKGEQK